MAPAFPSLSWWLWSGKQREPGISNEPLSTFSSEVGLWESALEYPLVNGASPSRRVNRKWDKRERRKVDQEYDVVLVPSDGGCISGSDSDDSDWSVGWLEPHGPEFQSDEDMNNSFAVLVRCYGKIQTDFSDNNKIFGYISDNPSDENVKYNNVQQLSSIQNASH